MKIEQLYAKRKEIVEKADAIQTQADKENEGVLSEEQSIEVEALLAESDEISAEIEKTETSLVTSNRLKAAKEKLTASRGRYIPDDINLGDDKTRITSFDNVLKDPKLGWGNFGEFCQSVFGAAGDAGKFDQRLLYGEAFAAANGLNQNTPSEGGFLVPPAFAAKIEDTMRMAPDNLMPLTDEFNITGESLTIPAVNEISRANGSRYGGIQSFWINEADVIVDSNPTFRQLRLEPQELAVLVFATNKLLQNTQALEQFLNKAASDEIIFRVNDAIINGTGAGQPLGILTSNAFIEVAANGGANTVLKEDIDDVWNVVPAKLRNNVVWLINQDVEPQLQNMELAVGTGGVGVYLPSGGLNDTPNDRLKGRRVMPIEYCPALGTPGDIILADMKGYALGKRTTGVDAAMSIHLKFDSAQTAFRFMFAVDGQPFLEQGITAFKGGTVRSSFAGIAVRA